MRCAVLDKIFSPFESVLCGTVFLLILLRFGHIISVVTERAVAAGEELLVCYNYRLDLAPPWYRTLWRHHSQGAAQQG